MNPSCFSKGDNGEITQNHLWPTPIIWTGRSRNRTYQNKPAIRQSYLRIGEPSLNTELFKVILPQRGIEPRNDTGNLKGGIWTLDMSVYSRPLSQAELPSEAKKCLWKCIKPEVLSHSIPLLSLQTPHKEGSARWRIRTFDIAVFSRPLSHLS